MLKSVVCITTKQQTQAQLLTVYDIVAGVQAETKRNHQTETTSKCSPIMTRVCVASL